MNCETCGAVVGDVGRHEQWHGALEQVERTADEALEKGEWAGNVLYQNGIEV